MAVGSLSFGQAALSLQGTLQKSTGLTVEDGEYSLGFKLYTTEVGGTPVWSETQTGVEVTGGVYSVILGAVNPLTASFDQPYFLGITIGNGAEATPRARLTASPYALSLIGQHNTFPSTGPVGIGTTGPDGSTELHIRDDDGDAIVWVESPGHASGIGLKDADQTAEMRLEGNVFKLKAGNDLPVEISSDKEISLRFGTSAKLSIVDNNLTSVNGARFVAGNGIFSSASGQDLTLERSGSVRMRMESGKTVIYGGVELPGVSNMGPVFNHQYMSPSGQGSSGPTADPSAALRTTNEIHAGTFRAISDRRVKTNIRACDPADDLAALMRLRPVSYVFIDRWARGDGTYKGLVAQEVREVMPGAVSATSDFVPDIYAFAQRTETGDGRLMVTTAEDHGLGAGVEVRLMLADGPRDVTVSAVSDSRRFTVPWEGPAPGQVFVFGRKVSDFLQVDYDQLHNLNLSATQELARRVLLLEAEKASLESGAAEQRQQLDDIARRLQRLEALVSGQAQR